MSGNSNLFTTSRFYRSSEHLVVSSPQQQQHYQQTSSYRHNQNQHLHLDSRESIEIHASLGPAPLSSSVPGPNYFSPWSIDNFEGFRSDLNANMFPSSHFALPSPSVAAQQCLQELHRSMSLLDESMPFRLSANSSSPSSSKSQPNINDLLNDMLSAAAAAHQSHRHNNLSFPDLASMFPVHFPPPPDMPKIFSSQGDGVYGNNVSNAMPNSRDSSGTTIDVSITDSSTPSQPHRSIITIPVQHRLNTNRDDDQANHNHPSHLPSQHKDTQLNLSPSKGDYDFLNCHHRRCRSPEGYTLPPAGNGYQHQNENDARQTHIAAKKSENRVTGIPPFSPSRPKSSTTGMSLLERRLSATPTPSSFTVDTRESNTPTVVTPIQDCNSPSSSRSGSSGARVSSQASMSMSSSSPSDSPHTPLRLRRWPSDSGLVTKQKQQAYYQSRQHRQESQYQWQYPSQHHHHQRPSSSLSASASNTMSSTASSSASSTLPSSNSSSDPEARPPTPPFPAEGANTTTEHGAAGAFDVGSWLAGIQR
ncbi:hypothetical protein ElyMa_006499000 [Elysia marginata]|uniref:Uncharacterized protein n=1 Tax=Elysia marginata TaxID=1093978 RepID=A0AAV4I4Y9_9GAST|nr:hypothetical protein ElyMa_006499000 [Elysia marginata]